MNIKNTIHKNLQILRTFLVMAIICETLVFTLLSRQFFTEYLNTFISLENSFSVSEKRNSIFNMITLMPQMNYHRPIQPNNKGQVIFTTDFNFVPKTRNITANDLTCLYQAESSFQRFLLKSLMEKINSVTNLSLTTDSTGMPDFNNTFTPFNSQLNLTVTANMHDMFIYFYYLANKPQIKFVDYQTSSINAYKVSEEFGLEFERQVYINQITQSIAHLFFWNNFCVGGVVVLLLCLIILDFRALVRLESCYDYSRLISISQAKITKLKAFLQKHELKEYFHLTPVEKNSIDSLERGLLKSSSFITLLRSSLILLPLVCLLVIPSVIHINVNGSLQRVNVETTESMVASLLNLEFLVAKAVINFQDSNYPRRTIIRIFRRKFLRFTNVIFAAAVMKNAKIQELKTNSNLCQSLQQLNMANCSAVYQGVFLKGYRVLSHLVLSELTTFFTDKATLFKINRSEDFYRLVMGYLYTTRHIFEQVKASIKNDYETFSKGYTLITGLLGVGGVPVRCVFGQQILSSTEPRLGSGAFTAVFHKVEGSDVSLQASQNY
jgi:hypothetical protein